jgi:hypothetical protein
MLKIGSKVQRLCNEEDRIRFTLYMCHPRDCGENSMPDRMCLLFLTSGTSGYKRGCISGNRDIYNNSRYAASGYALLVQAIEGIQNDKAVISKGRANESN